MGRFTVPAFNRSVLGVDTGTINVGDIDVKGNVEAPIVIGNNNTVYSFSPHIENGVVVNFEASPSIRRLGVNPQPPRTPRNFVGRDQELKDVEQRIRDNGVLLIHGHDGIGKTALVKKAANSDSANSMPDGVFYLEGIGEDVGLGFEDILQSIFDAFYESNLHTKVSASTAQVHLGNIRPLIVLDNMELSVDALNRLPDVLAKGSLVVTAHRSQLADGYQPIELSPLTHQDAIQLLIATSGGTADPNSQPWIDRICTLLEDTPLAIVQIGNFIQRGRLSLKSAVDGLEGIRPPSQDQVQAAIERSFGLIYTLLDPEERTMLAAVAAAPGLSVDRQWLESVAGGKKISEALESLELLQANSPRLRLHDSLKQILGSGRRDIQTFRGLLLEHFVVESPNRSRDFEYMADELGNILGLIQWATREGRWSNVIALGRAVDPYLTAKGFWDAWETVLRQVLLAAEKLADRATQAWAYHQLGSREIGAGTIPQAIQDLVQALRMRESLGDREGYAYTLHNLRLILPPPEEQETEPKEPSGGSDTVWYGTWLERVRVWYARNPGWFVAALFAGLLLFAIAVAAIYDLFNNPLEMTVQAERLNYTDPSRNAIQYIFSIRNKSDTPLLTGPVSVISETIESFDCPTISRLGNFDNLLDTGETVVCKSVYTITPADQKRGSVTNRVRVQVSDNIKSGWVSTTTDLAPGKPAITLSMSPDVNSYERVEQEIKYTFTITNTGDVFLRQPAEIKSGNETMQVDCDQTSAEGEAEYLPPNETLTCTGVYNITQSDLDQGSMTNTAVAVVDGIESNEASSTIRASVRTGLELTTTADPEIYEKVGQTIRFTHTLVNKGNITLRELPVINNDLSSNPCTVLDLIVPESLTPENELVCVSIYTVTQEDVDRGSLTNRAVARIGDFASNESVVTVNALQNPALEVAVAAGPSSFGRAGETINFTYTIANRGNVTLDPVQPAVNNAPNGTAGQVNCGTDRIALAPEASQTCTSTYTTTVADIDAKAVSNIAKASANFREVVVESPTVTTDIPFVCPGPPAGWVPYTVRAGNTLLQIGNVYDLPVSRIQEANCMGSSVYVYSGQRLHVPYLVTVEGLIYNTSNNSGIPNFSVTLKFGNGNIIATTTTGSDGRYLFSNLLPGDYWVLDAPVTYTSRTRGVRNFGLVPVP